MTRSWPRAACFVAAIMALAAGPDAGAEPRYITVASTTSTESSGLFNFILPRFSSRTGIEVRVIARGTGQALETARRGDTDVLLVHHRPSEEAFVSEGYGLRRHDLMYNDFVLVGPAADPAAIGGGSDVVAAVKLIAAAKAVFMSRGDDSGTHLAELGFWRLANLDPRAVSGTWYRETGAGMGATLNTASQAGAMTLVDRATWLGFRNKRDLTVLVEGDPRMFNQYGVILVDPARHPHVKAGDGQAFVDWLLSPGGQGAIAAFRIDGKQVFFPNAAAP